MSNSAGQAPATLASVVEDHYDDLMLFIGNRCGSRVVAEEIIQETWVRAKSASGIVPENPRAYVFRIARNLLTDHYRRNSNDREQVVLPFRHASSTSIDGNTCEHVEIDRTASQEDVAAAQQELRIISRTVENLPMKCRQVFLMYRGEELSMREISEKLDVSVKTVENHIRRAMLECRRSLQQAHSEK
ncbi:RNA polymerase sigma factor (sigma-70 family) [Thalassospira sp. MBR-102]|uniref:RNA polymerase sigma factor n=1 Tax=Thalassospira TaxID=168934 RepID=UPI000B318D91|nr:MULTISPECIES: RNA polymerase sigma factor [Thalassospira]MDM7977524.1 RNA polymerase sigma factor [Thalassospira xiamenensis]